jgi:hypothetical protein
MGACFAICEKDPQLEYGLLALNDAKIRSLKPTGKAYKIADFGGLYIKVTVKDFKLWTERAVTAASKCTPLQ